MESVGEKTGERTLATFDNKDNVKNQAVYQYFYGNVYFGNDQHPNPQKDGNSSESSSTLDEGNILREPDGRHQNTLFGSSSPSKPSQEVVQACVPISNLYHKDTTAMETLDEQYEVNVPSDVVSCLDRWYSGYTKDILFWGEDRSYWLDSVAHQAAQNLVRKGEAVIFIQPPPNAVFTDGDDLVRDFLALFAECLQLKEHRIDRDRLSVLESMVARSSSRVVVFFHRLRFVEAGQGEFSQLVQALLQSERFRVFVTSESYLRRPNGKSVVNVSGMFPGRTRVSLR